MEKRSFGRTSAGREAALYTIANSKGMRAEVTDFGAALVSLYVKDKSGSPVDVVLGYEDAASYEHGQGYLGATIGRNGNRIANASLEIDGVAYPLEPNDFENNLHSGSKGTSARFWEVKSCEDNRIVLTIEDADLEQGYPGNATMTVTYEVTEDNGLAIRYEASADKKTVFNLTNHSYFNLSGQASGDILDCTLQIKASHYTPVKDKKAIPTGEIAPVDGTPFDFREAKAIGRDIRADHIQLTYGNGYDHNFVLDRIGDGLEKVARVCSPKTGIQMEVITDCIGMQLYTANGVGGQKGKGGTVYQRNAALCLETQFFPNSVNEPNFVSPLTDAGETYRSETIYQFSADGI